MSGAATFVVTNTIVDSRVAAGAGQSSEVPLPDAASDALSGAEADQREKLIAAAQPEPGSTGVGVAFALLAAVTLDGVPENLALGVSLVGSEGELSGVIALLVAIFVSNLPESLVGAVAMRAGGRSHRFVVVIWAITAIILTAAVVVGERLADSMSPGVLAFALCFAGGAVLASLADTLMPKAFEHGRTLNALSTTFGFLLAFVLSDFCPPLLRSHRPSAGGPGRGRRDYWTSFSDRVDTCVRCCFRLAPQRASGHSALPIASPET